MSERWRKKVGGYGYTVTVEERTKGGPLWFRVWDSEANDGKGNWRRKSLKHRDKAKAVRQAAELSESLKLQEDPHTVPNLGQVFRAYLETRTPKKRREKQKSTDRRQAKMWVRFLGAEKNPGAIVYDDLDRFCELRSSGAIDARGNPVLEGSRRPVGDRTVGADIEKLSIVLNWGCDHERMPGVRWVEKNMVSGYDIPRESSPYRPVATEKEYRKLLSAAHDHTMEIRWRGSREPVPSYLADLMVLVHETGHRITAVCELTTNDWIPDLGAHGSVRWAKEIDKEEHEHVVPVNALAAEVLRRRAREAVEGGRLPLFPAPSDPRTAMSKDLANTWFRQLRKAEGIRKLNTHALRRKWASDRRHLPDKDVAAAGGWTDIETMKRCYQHADFEGMQSVVNAGTSSQAS